MSCKYYDEIQFTSKFQNVKNFYFLSLNIQSLPAKFNEFQEFINNLQVNNCHPDILLLQETWQISDPLHFPLNNYNPLLCKLRSNLTQGGGVGMYFKNNLRYKILPEKSIFIDRVFESIFAEVWINKKKL